MDNIELECLIKSKLMQEMNDGAKNITVRTNTDIVELSGFVNKSTEKIFAAKKVCDFVGKSNTINNILITSDQFTRDCDIEDNVIEKLEQDINLTNICAESNNGIVTLIGSVTSYAYSNKSLELAMGANGVKSVISNIRIEPKHKHDDIVLLDAINDVLTKNCIEPNCIIVDVNEDTVTLKGFVDDDDKKELAKNLIQKISSNMKVKNYLILKQ